MQIHVVAIPPGIIRAAANNQTVLVMASFELAAKLAALAFIAWTVVLISRRSPLGRWFRDLAVRLTPASVNDRVLRRILTDMPGVPLEMAAPVVEEAPSEIGGR